jgi:hypothetical protein
MYNVLRTTRTSTPVWLSRMDRAQRVANQQCEAEVRWFRKRVDRVRSRMARLLSLLCIICSLRVCKGWAVTLCDHEAIRAVTNGELG